MRNIFTKTVAVMAMSVTTLTAWSAGTAPTHSGESVSIPTALDSYIDWNYATFKDSKGDVENSGANCGSTKAETEVTFTLSNATEQEYYLAMKTGAKELTAVLSVTVSNADGEIFTTQPSNNLNVVHTDNSWSLSTQHYRSLGVLPVGDLTLKIKVESTTGSYAGNWGDLAIHGVNQYSWQSIPQDLGSYIVLGNATGTDGFANYITNTNCQVDSRLGDAGNSKYYSTGSTHENTKLNINVSAIEAGNYVFGFKSGASGCSSVVNVKMTAFGGETPMFTSDDVTIANDGNWDPNRAHNFYIPNVAAGYYTISMEVKEKTGSYAGNFGNFFFHHVNQLAWATSSAYMELSDGTFTNARDNNDNVINYIGRTGGSIDDLLVYNSEADYRIFHFNIDSHKQTSKVTITVTDFETGVQEAQTTKVVATNGDYFQPMTTEISAGLKKIRFDFADNDETADNDYLYNFRQVYFTSPAYYEALPLTETAELNLNQAGRIFHDCSYEEGNSNIGYVKNGSYADNYIIYNTNETTHYILNAGIPWYKKGGTFKITITDVATGNVEVDAQESPVITGTGNIQFGITNAITHGMKKIRFDFVNEGETDYLFNLNNVYFTKLPYTRTHPHMNLNTLCFPYQIDSYTGATFYTILETEVNGSGELTKLVLEEAVAPLAAGTPYFYDPDPESSELVCNVSGAYTEVQPGAGGLTGSYADDSPVPANKYVTVNNMLYKTGDNVTMGEYRAYVDPVAYSRAAMAGRKRRTIGRYDAPTAVESIQDSEICVQKVIRNGQLIIIRDGVEYNAMGQVLK